MSNLMDDPNREAVGLEPAWVEGTGGSDNLGGGSSGKDKGKAAKTKTKAEVEAETEAGEEK